MSGARTDLGLGLAKGADGLMHAYKTNDSALGIESVSECGVAYASVGSEDDRVCKECVGHVERELDLPSGSLPRRE